MATIRIIGKLIIPNGEPAKFREVQFKRMSPDVAPTPGGGVVIDTVSFFTDIDANLDAKLVPGRYVGEVADDRGRVNYNFAFTITGEETGGVIALQDLLAAASFGDPAPYWFTEITGAADVVRGLVDEAEGYAGDAEAAATLAEAVVSSVQPFSDRAAAVLGLPSLPSDIKRAGWITPTGIVSVMREDGAICISDMQGWIPDGEVTPRHVGAVPLDYENDYSSKVQPLMDWCGALRIPLVWDAMYRIDGVLQVSGLHCYGRNMGGLYSREVVSRSTPELGGQNVVYGHSLSDFSWNNVIFDNSENQRFVAGLRTIGLYGCSDFTVSGCQFATGGAATACLNSHNYLIENNVTLCQTSYYVSDQPRHQHDGIYDQWWGSHDFKIRGNTVRSGNLRGKYPILVTGQTTTSLSSACYDFEITDNVIEGYDQVGIWAQGRNGGCKNFIISGNRIIGEGAGYFGIGASEFFGGNISDNIVVKASNAGIQIYTENSEYSEAQKAFVVSGNVIIDPNELLTTGMAGSGVVVRSDSAMGYIGGNVVTGTKHTYGLSVVSEAGDNLNIGPGYYQPGTVGTINFNGATKGAGFATSDGAAQIFSSGRLRVDVTSSKFRIAGITGENQTLSVGEGRTTNGLSQLQLHSGGGTSSLSFNSFSGVNGAREIRSFGTGGFSIATNDASPLMLSTANAERVRILDDGRIGIGTATPHSSATLEINSTAGGLRLPRLTTAQRDAIASPASGLLIFNTTTSKFQGWSGTAWVEL